MIELVKINHNFKKKKLLEDFSLKIKSNAVTSILGQSGSGKTTLLRLICGLEKIQAGVINFENNLKSQSSELIKKEEHISFVFQDSALFPHLNTIENIFYGLSKKNHNLTNKIHALINDHNLDKIKFSYPHQLSGGQKQLVALLRGLASSPKIILLDEPFSNLDTRLREKLRDQVLHILKDYNITSVIVTHDADEAMFMSDYIAVLQNGKLQQFGKPVDLYTRPRNRFVAEFFGEINILPGKKIKSKLSTPLGLFSLNQKSLISNYSLVVRSEGIKITNSSTEDTFVDIKKNIHLVKSPNNGRVIESKFLGGSTIVHLGLKGMQNNEHLHVKIPGINYFENNQIVNLYTDVNYSYIFES